MSTRYESTQRTHRVVLTPAQKDTIRKLKGTVRQLDLARRFGVSDKTIKAIWREHADTA